jgi:hypothetical protein
MECGTGFDAVEMRNIFAPTELVTTSNPAYSSLSVTAVADCFVIKFDGLNPFIC